MTQALALRESVRAHILAIWTGDSQAENTMKTNGINSVRVTTRTSVMTIMNSDCKLMITNINANCGTVSLVQCC